MDEAARVLDFWMNEVGEEGWYVADPRVDARIVAEFMTLWERARDGDLDGWRDTPEGTLALLIVTDQFSRNMFRGDARSFATDSLARDVARTAIARGDDLRVPEPQRVFFYMPFEHSEAVADQDWSVSLMDHRLPETGEGFGLHSRAHREIIRRFGRFPYRNAPLGRDTTAAEQKFLDAGGYGAMVRELSEAAAQAAS